MVSDFVRRVASIPPELCAPVHEEARNLETQLVTIYQLIARLVRRAEELEHVAKLWSVMVSTCDMALSKLRELVERRPACGADTYYDRILDLRNKCQRLQEMHS